MKTKINNLSFQRLRVGELSAFITLILPIINACPTIGDKLKRLLQELAQTMVALEASTNPASFEPQTKAVKAADKNRDRSLSRFVHLVEYFQLSDVAAEAEAANLILKAIKDSGDIFHMGLKAETSALHGLNALFTTNPRYVAALTLLKATAEWGKVWALQQEFETTYGYRNGVMVEEKPDAAAYEVAKTASKQCSSILELVEDLYNVEEKPEYLAIMEKVNVEIDKTMAIVRTRETLAAKAREEEKKKS